MSESVQPPLPPIETLPVESESVEEEGTTEGEKVEVNDDEGDEGEDEEVEAKVAGVHKGKDDWTAVWSQESNSYYFWNSKTNVTTWENPLSIPTASTSDIAPPLPPSTELPPPLPTEPTEPDLYNGVDKDLAYLDPSLAHLSSGSSMTQTFKARFNSKTGRFQGDPSMNPDRISDFTKGKRQQEAFYNTEAWQESLGGKGIKRSGEVEEGEDDGNGKRIKRPSAKEVAQFKQNKVDKKRAKLTAFLA